MLKKKSFTLEEAKKKLEHYCAYQERCHKEVHYKLIELGVIPQAREEVKGHLIQENYLNESRFAQSFARGKFRIKKWGKIRIIIELKQRSISEYNIKLGLKEISEEEYNKTFYALFEKRHKETSHLSKVEQKKKIIDFLNYRGWEKQLIFETLRDTF